MKTLAEKCLRDNTIGLKVAPYYYKMCDKKYECVQDPCVSTSLRQAS